MDNKNINIFSNCRNQVIYLVITYQWPMYLTERSPPPFWFIIALWDWTKVRPIFCEGLFFLPWTEIKNSSEVGSGYEINEVKWDIWLPLAKFCFRVSEFCPKKQPGTHIRGQSFSILAKTDIYMVGMLCLWSRFIWFGSDCDKKRKWTAWAGFLMTCFITGI